MPNAGVSTSNLPGVPGQVPAAQLLRSASPAAWLPASQKQLCPKRALKSLPASPAACQPTCRPIYLPGTNANPKGAGVCDGAGVC